MPDLIQETYEVLNQYLGETNNRNTKRLPEKYDQLLRAVENLVQYAHQLGVKLGKDEVKRDLYNMFQSLQQETKYPQYKSLGAEEKK